MILAFCIAFNGVFFHLGIKNFAEVICNTENFSNFVLGDHSDYCLWFADFEHLEITTIFANHQFFNDLYFVELTLNKQLKPEEVFVYGKTSRMGKGSDAGETHFGIGGYEVQKLMREFGGDAEFISDPESDFPVSYKLSFFNTNFKGIVLW